MDWEQRFEKQRCWFLLKALNDARTWCVPPACHVGRYPSDQFWLQLFSSGSDTGVHRNAYTFLVAFRLIRGKEWNTKLVADQIMAFRSQAVSDAPAAVSGLAKVLSGYIVKGQKGLQTSAASKLAFFTKPLEKVYIWDQFAIASARFRDRRRRQGRRPKPARSYYRNVSGTVEHDYASYAASCAKALEEERSGADFKGALQEFRSYLQKVGGPMSESKYSLFVERRFLDKLMWWEGNWLKEQKQKRLHKAQA